VFAPYSHAGTDAHFPILGFVKGDTPPSVTLCEGIGRLYTSPYHGALAAELGSILPLCQPDSVLVYPEDDDVPLAMSTSLFGPWADQVAEASQVLIAAGERIDPDDTQEAYRKLVHQSLSRLSMDRLRIVDAKTESALQEAQSQYEGAGTPSESQVYQYRALCYDTAHQASGVMEKLARVHRQLNTVTHPADSEVPEDTITRSRNQTRQKRDAALSALEKLQLTQVSTFEELLLAMKNQTSSETPSFPKSRGQAARTPVQTWCRSLGR
jgi:hypothetical protein